VSDIEITSSTIRTHHDAEIKLLYSSFHFRSSYSTCEQAVIAQETTPSPTLHDDDQRAVNKAIQPLDLYSSELSLFISTSKLSPSLLLSALLYHSSFTLRTRRVLRHSSSSQIQLKTDLLTLYGTVVQLHSALWVLVRRAICQQY
jgi:hypothetical protein